MDLGQLRYFTKIVEHRSFTKAARDCSVSQPALSQQIGKLEKELGQPLFERQGRTIRLTTAGQWLHLKAGKILQLADDAKRQITDDGETGRICVSAIPTIAPYLLPSILKHAATLIPKAEFVVGEATTDDLLKRCANGDVDVGILALPVASKYLTIEPLFSEQLLLAVATENPLCQKDDLVVADMLDQNFLLLRDTHCLVDAIASHCHREEFQSFASSRIEQLTTIQFLISMNIGVSLVPEMATGIDLGGKISYRRLNATSTQDPPSRTVAMCFNPHRYQSKLLRKFIAGIKQLCMPDSLAQTSVDDAEQSGTESNLSGPNVRPSKNAAAKP